MRKFIINILLYLVILVFAIQYYDLTISLLINHLSTYKVNEKHIVIGHSHPECAFNDAIIADFKNVSSSAESYFYTKAKLSKILEENSNIETVFIEFSNNQIESNQDMWIWEEPYMSRNYPQYAPFMDYSDKTFLFRKNPIDYLNSFGLSQRKNISDLSFKSYDYTDHWGGYLSINKNKVYSFLNINNRGDSLLYNKISKSNLDYLDKVIKICQKVTFLDLRQLKKTLLW